MTQQPEEDLPIDIDYAKFLDWLINRQRVPRNWHTLLKTARTLTRTALSHTPPDLQNALNIPSTDSREHLPYFTVRTIFQSLTNPSAPSEWGSQEKDLLGRYKSPLHRAWYDAHSAFQKKNVYLADAAQQLVRNADVEAPAIKATVAKLNAEIADSARREGPSIRAAQEARTRFADACHEFSLNEDSQDFETQLKEQIELRVPDLLAAVVHIVKDDVFGDTINYYDDFADFIATKSTKPSNDICKTVKEIREGDVDQLIRKLKSVEDITEIQWGEDSGMDVPAPLNEDENAADIDWGIEIEVDASGSAVQATGESQEADVTIVPEAGINWDEHGTGSEITTFVSDQESSASDGLTLTDPAARERCLTDLLELDGFLTQRATELSCSAGSEIGLVLQQATVWPDSIKRVDIDRVGEMQGAIKRAIDGINSDETRRILALQSNRKRLEKAARTVVEKKLVAERMEGAIVSLKERRARAVEHLANESPKLKELGDITREVKRWTEEALSTLFRGRRVHILGEINNVFPPTE